MQLILEESKEVLRAERNVLITETHHGLVCANAGIDTSNLPEDGTVCLLPEDPDASARSIRAEITARSLGDRARGGDQPTASVAPGASGQAEVAIGCAGLTPLDDWRGRNDAHGRELEATMIAIADEAAAAADLVRSKDSQVPAVVVRGLVASSPPMTAPAPRPFAARPTRTSSADVEAIPVGVERLVLFRRRPCGVSSPLSIEKVKWNPYRDGPKTPQHEAQPHPGGCRPGSSQSPRWRPPAEGPRPRS